MQGEAPHILVVDDDTRLRELLRKYLSENGFRVTTAQNAGQARKRMKALAFDLVVLDVMMPGESGLQLATWLQRGDGVPVLLLTAMGEPEDRISGLETGADDYLTKPFEPRELLLRVRNLLKRREAAEAPDEVCFGDYRFDLGRERLYRDGAAVPLTATEARLLRTLALQQGRPLSRQALTREAGGGTSERTVDVQVTRLRRKIEPDPKLPRYLQTVRGKGYTLLPD